MIKLKNVLGFSLYEILITMLILSIVMSIALPNLSKMISDHKKEKNLDVLNAAIYMAKNHAINNRVVVTLEKGTLGTNDSWNSFKLTTKNETIFEYPNLNGFKIDNDGKIKFNINGQVLDADNNPITTKSFCIGNDVKDNTKYILNINYLGNTTFEEKNECKEIVEE